MPLSAGASSCSTRFHEIRFDHLRVEIGWTWITRRVWGRGHNVETKLLLLARAFEDAHLRRVRDSAYYSVIDDEWPTLKAKLEARVQRHLAG